MRFFKSIGLSIALLGSMPAAGALGASHSEERLADEAFLLKRKLDATRGVISGLAKNNKTMMAEFDQLASLLMASVEKEKSLTKGAAIQILDAVEFAAISIIFSTMPRQTGASSGSTIISTGPKHLLNDYLLQMSSLKLPSTPAFITIGIVNRF